MPICTAVAEYPLGADIEKPNDALRVRGDALKADSVEARTLQRPRLERRRFCPLAQRIVAEPLKTTILLVVASFSLATESAPITDAKYCGLRR